MKKRATRLTLNLVKSTYTGIVYLALFEDSVPVKFWPYDSVNKAGLNIISELFKGFDLGYDIEFQFPRELKGERKLVPTEMVLVGEPGGKEQNIFNKKNAIPESKFYQKEIEENPEILPDQKMLDFLEMYKEEKGL